jgi:hypothetical protein
MDATQLGVSCCQRCRHYTPEGRRGGHCDQLSVPVQGKWAPCPLAVPFFVDSIDTVPSLPIWSEALVLAHRDAVPLATDYFTPQR